jgi:ABC-type oligopeptide transport system ATPase subunit
MLVADEATSMLDASLRVNVLNVLKDLRDQLGMTVLSSLTTSDRRVTWPTGCSSWNTA